MEPSKISKPKHERKATANKMADANWTLTAAARFTLGGASPTPDHDATELQRRSRIETEERRLVDWARANGKLGKRLPPEDTRGGEHAVYYDESSQRFWKTTIPEAQKGYGIALGSWSRGATPGEYLERILLLNRVFNDDIRLEGIILKNRRPIIVTSQPAIAGRAAPALLVDQLMVAGGFEKLTEGAYHRAGLMFFDLFPRNVILAGDGMVYPIDPVIQRIDRDFLEFLRANPEVV
jgi:hypothetical protein